MIDLPNKKSKSDIIPSHARVAEIVAALMWGEKKQAELKDTVDLSHDTLKRCMRALQASGVVYRKKGFKGTLTWGLQKTPFEIKDET